MILFIVDPLHKRLTDLPVGTLTEVGGDISNCDSTVCVCVCVH